MKRKKRRNVYSNDVIISLLDEMSNNNIAMTVYDMWDFMYPKRKDKLPQYKAHMLQRLIKLLIERGVLRVLHVKYRSFKRGRQRYMYIVNSNYKYKLER
jgi:hypothetical protein